MDTELEKYFWLEEVELLTQTPENAAGVIITIVTSQGIQ
jgi:hypothetical protein